MMMMMIIIIIIIIIIKQKLGFVPDDTLEESEKIVTFQGLVVHHMILLYM